MMSFSAAMDSIRLLGFRSVSWLFSGLGIETGNTSGWIVHFQKNLV